MTTEVTLTGQKIRLRPMQDNDAAALLAAASDGELWNLKVTTVPSPETVSQYIHIALKGKEAGTRRCRPAGTQRSRCSGVTTS